MIINSLLQFFCLLNFFSFFILNIFTLFPTSALAAITNINGAGATFPYPLYSKWFAEYSKTHPDTRFNYQSIGSGGGIQQLLAGTVDFGASDVPMKAEESKKSAHEILHLPTILGAVAIVYHLEGNPAGVKLTGELLAKIYLGQITKWNDPLITKLNPGINFPNKAILVSYRSDGSGTTAVFTEYLSTLSEPWKKNVGSGKAVRWPMGIGGKGNEGVTGIVKQMKGSLGYVELAYALQNKLQVAAIQNKQGEFQTPSLQSISLAAAALQAQDLKKSVVNSPTKGAYPLASTTYLLIPKKKLTADKLKSMKAFLNWAMDDGQKMAALLHYAPLPEELRKAIKAEVQKL